MNAGKNSAYCHNFKIFIRILHVMKAVIFDLGGIFIDIDYNATSKSFVNAGFVNFDEVYSQSKQEPFVDAFERGKLSNETFRKKMLQHSPAPMTSKDFDKAWNAMLGAIRVDKLEMVAKYRGTYDFFLYSNTNDIHLSVFEQWIDKDYPEFNSLFESVYYSCEFGYNKPYEDGFLEIIKRNNLVANETVFVDDTIRHVETARSIGLKGIHVPSNLSVSELESTLFLDKAP